MPEVNSESESMLGNPGWDAAAAKPGVPQEFLDRANQIVARYCWHTAPLAAEDVVNPSESFEAWATELPGHRIYARTPWGALGEAIASAVRMAAISLAKGRSLPVPVCDQSRCEQVNIKLTARELASLRDEARRQNKSVSELGRDRMLARDLQHTDHEQILKIWDNPNAGADPGDAPRAQLGDTPST